MPGNFYGLIKCYFAKKYILVDKNYTKKPLLKIQEFAGFTGGFCGMPAPANEWCQPGP